MLLKIAMLVLKENLKAPKDDLEKNLRKCPYYKGRAIADPAFVTHQQTNNYFTASFNAFAATNFGTLRAAIYISSPV
jgi:hypothetical protein